MVAEINILEETQTSIAKIYRRDDGIIKVKLHDNIEVDIEQSRELFNTMKKFSKEPKDLLVLVVAGKYSTATKEVREFSSSDEASSITLAEAIVLHSLAQKLVINFMLKVFKPKRHIKMFTNEEEAVQWLHSWKQN